MDDYCKRSGQIPAFGDWDYANELPITQYFECARQAGLIRFSSSTGKSNPYGLGDLYAVDLSKHPRNHAPARKVSSRARDKPQVKAGRVCDVTELPRKYQQPQHSHQHHVPCSNKSNNNNNNNDGSKQVGNDVVPPKRLPVCRPPKPVDEDLYKIPPELLHSSKRKKMPGFFSCLVPACAT